MSVVAVAQGVGRPWEVRLQHDRQGRETLRTMTGGVACAMQYDGVGRPSRQSVTRSGHSLYDRGYRWDDDFLLSHAHDAISGRIARYFYDDFGSLAEAEYGDGARQWRNPDVMGNVYDSADRTDRTYARGGQLREDRRWRYHYDKQGNLVLKTKRKIRADLEHAVSQTKGKGFFGLFSGSNTSKEKGREDGALTWHPGDYAYTWLPNGMLGSVTRPDGKIVTFKYDALGRRIEKTFNGRVHRYLWDGDVVLHEWEYDETERPQQIVAENGDVSFDRPEPTDNLVTWIYDTDGYVPTAKLVNGKRYGIVSDYIGRPVQAYDEHGTVVWQADYDIYGNLLNLKGDRGFVPFRQLGQYEDEETGLYYNRFRYYSPESGLYISQDPIGLAGNNPTLYGYVSDNNSWVDPLGLTELTDLVDEAHSLLDPRAQRSKTTAIGVGQDGKIYIASSDELVPKVQRDWAIPKNIEPIRGIGHAEETLINANKGIRQIDASRKVCLDCEHMMIRHNVTTDTEKSGKRSKNRIMSCK